MSPIITRSTSFLSALALVVVLVLAPTALAQTDSPFNPLPQAPAQTVQTPTVTTRTTSQTNVPSDGLKTWQAVLIVLAGMILLLGIAMAILRDARTRAPVVEEDEAFASQHSRDAHSVSRDAKARQRKKAKAVRAQRKHNR